MLSSIWPLCLCCKKNINNTTIRITLSETKFIYESNIGQRQDKTFGIFHRLAVEWIQQAFIYGVIGNMTDIKKRCHKKQIEPSQEIGV